MIDITKDEFWDSRYEEVTKKEKKNSRVKNFIIKHKIITLLLGALSVLMVINTILIYNFFRILTDL